MAAAIIQGSYYNAGSIEMSGIYAVMQIEVERPPAPFIGMHVFAGVSPLL